MTETWLLELGDHDPAGHPGHVAGAQWILAGHNKFGIGWYHGPIDGSFGPDSAKAARQAKFDIGYTSQSVRPTFGPLLRDYLLGRTRRSPAMVARAAARHRGTFVWPTAPHGIVIGTPGVGTHSFTVPPNNWESDNAWDIAVPLNSKILAVADGTIGKDFGPLPDPDPRFHGIRLHLEIPGNEFYYAHLASTVAGLGPGSRVKQGQTLGLSGQANGVAHLHLGVEHLGLFDLAKL